MIDEKDKAAYHLAVARHVAAALDDLDMIADVRGQVAAMKENQGRGRLAGRGGGAFLCPQVGWSVDVQMAPFEIGVNGDIGFQVRLRLEYRYTSPFAHAGTYLYSGSYCRLLCNNDLVVGPWLSIEGEEGDFQPLFDPVEQRTMGPALAIDKTFGKLASTLRMLPKNKDLVEVKAHA